VDEQILKLIDAGKTDEEIVAEVFENEELWIYLGHAIASGDVDAMKKFKEQLMAVGEIKIGEAKEISVNPPWSNVIFNIKVEPIGDKHKLSVDIDYTT